MDILNIMGIAFDTVEQGLLWSIMVLGVYITFRVLDYADLTVDSSFTLGAAVAARFIFLGYNPWLGTLLAIVAGGVAGMITGILHTQFKIAPLLSGILSMIGLYSINLHIMQRANISLLRMDTIITSLSEWGISEDWVVLILGIAVATLVVILLWLFLNTELGFAMRATGDNEQMILSSGVNTNMMKIMGLAISNALVAFSGALIAQHQNFADIGMGIGTIVIGLASVIVGEVIFGRTTILRTLIAVVFGSIIYRLIIAIVLELGLPAIDLRLFTSLIVILALATPVFREKLQRSLNTRKGEENA